MSEFDLIRDYFKPATASRQDVILGIGDDCALMQAPVGQQLAMSMDTLLVGRHFAPNIDPSTLGHKSLAVNLSDLAAMGATPAWAMLSLSLPQADQKWRDWLAHFMQGFSALAQQYAMQLVGGDTTQGELAVTLQVTGFVKTGAALKRNAAQIDDDIYVSGNIGDAALALLTRQAEVRPRLDCPTPRVELGQQLVGVAHAAIDVSDGLLADLQHICTASGVSAQVCLADIPTSKPVKEHLTSTNNWQPILNGGDDYELVFTAAPTQQEKINHIAQQLDISLQKIGNIQAGRGVGLTLFDGQTTKQKIFNGYDHFAH